MYLFYFCKRVTSLAVGFIEIHCPENHLFKEEHLTLGKEILKIFLLYYFRKMEAVNESGLPQLSLISTNLPPPRLVGST